MELNQQIFRAPSIPKISSRTISSSVIRGAVKPQIKLNRSAFSFIKPVQKTIDTEKISTVSAGKDISVEATLGETNRILVEIQKQLALDFGYRIAEEKKALALERKKIAAQKVADKEAKIEKDGRSILGKTFEKVTAPFKSIFQKLIDFFSVILTGILLNTAFKWLSNPENRKKLAEFFNFLKEYWQELLIVFGIAKLAKLVAKIFSIASKIKKLLSLWPKKPPTTGTGKNPCNCPPSGTPDFCKNILDCFDPVKVESLAQKLAATKTFSPLFGTPSPIFQPAAKPTTRPQPPVLPVFPTPGLTPTPTNPLTLPIPPTPNIPKPGKSLGEYLQDAQKSFRESTSFLDPLANLIESPTFQTATMVSPAGFGSGAMNLFNLSRLGGIFGGLNKAKKLSQTPAPQLSTPSVIQPSIQGLGQSFVRIQKSNKIIQNAFGKKYNINNEDDLFRILGSRFLDNPTIVRENLLTGTTRKGYLELLEELINMKQRSIIPKQLDLLGKSKGGTIGGRGPGNVDTVPAMLAAGEEVIRTSSSMLFRPLLKDINDNAGRLWQAFSGATQKQNTNNIIQSELNKQFNVLIKQFKELIGNEIKRIQSLKNKSTKPPGGGPITAAAGLREYSQKSQPVSQINLSSIGADNSAPQMTQNITNSYPTNFVSNIISPQLKSDNKNIIVLPVPVKNLQRQTQKPKVNIINLPPKTVNLGPKPGSIKTPSSGEATSVPSISPFDSSNPYIAYTRSALGMVM